MKKTFWLDSENTKKIVEIGNFQFYDYTLEFKGFIWIEKFDKGFKIHPNYSNVMEHLCGSPKLLLTFN